MCPGFEESNFEETGSKIHFEEIEDKYMLFTNWIFRNLAEHDLSSFFMALFIVIFSWMVINWLVRLIIAIIWPITFITILVVCNVLFENLFYILAKFSPLQYILPTILNGSIFSLYLNSEIGYKDVMLKFGNILQYFTGSFKRCFSEYLKS